MNSSPGIQRFERYLWLTIIAALIIIFFVRYEDDQKKIHTLQEKNKTMTKEISTLEDSMFSILHNLGGYPRLSYEQVEYFRNLGLVDPLNDIINNLKKHPELIPFKGVLGGTMHFSEKEGVYVLNINYVLAAFSDGHIAGSMLLQYDVAPGGKISWKTVNARLE
jgi:hypothetical protein